LVKGVEINKFGLEVVANDYVFELEVQVSDLLALEVLEGVNKVMEVGSDQSFIFKKIIVFADLGFKVSIRHIFSYGISYIGLLLAGRDDLQLVTRINLFYDVGMAEVGKLLLLKVVNLASFTIEVEDLDSIGLFRVGFVESKVNLVLRFV